MNRTLRIILAIVLIITLYFAYVMIFTPPMLFQIYEVTLFDPMHRYLSMAAGSLLVVIAIGAGLAFLQPVRFVSIVLMLILYHLARFVVDMILIAQGDIAMTTLLPEMVYFVVMSALLVRFFPQRQEETKDSMDMVVSTEGKTAAQEDLKVEGQAQ